MKPGYITEHVADIQAEMWITMAIDISWMVIAHLDGEEVREKC